MRAGKTHIKVGMSDHSIASQRKGREGGEIERPGRMMHCHSLQELWTKYACKANVVQEPFYSSYHAREGHGRLGFRRQEFRRNTGGC